MGDSEMPNMFDYLEWRGDIKLWQSGFNNVDALIMTELAYINHDGIVPENFEDGLVTLAGEAYRSFLCGGCHGEVFRYRHLRICEPCR